LATILPLLDLGGYVGMRIAERKSRDKAIASIIEFMCSGPPISIKLSLKRLSYS
jgi:hypothetical protein